MLQVGIGPQRHFVDREFAGISSAHRDEIDQGGGVRDLGFVYLGGRRNILVGTLTQDAADAARHAVDFGLQRIGNVGADRRQLLAPIGIVAQVEFGTQAAYAVMQDLQLFADTVELAAPYVRAQAGRQKREIVQRQRNGNAKGCRSHAKFVVGCRHLDGEADNLPGGPQPLHDQRQRERHKLRSLQRGSVERFCHRHDLGVGKGPQLTRKPAAQRVHRLARAQDRPDRQQVFDDVWRADTGKRTLPVIGRDRRDVEDCLGDSHLESARTGFQSCSRAALPDPGQQRLEGPRLVRRAVPGKPLPDRRQRGAPDLALPQREIAFDQKRLDGAEQQPCRIVGPRPCFLVFLGSAHDLAQLLEHEGCDSGVLAALDGALELPHQQRLRLRRELGEIVPQPLDRCLAHAPGMAMCRPDGKARPPAIIKVCPLRSR